MLIDFLKTQRSREDLKTALDVLREFKSCESDEEWFLCPCAAWTKLEQMEEYLAHLAADEPLEADTLEQLAG
ncbi:hypothetical protein [Shumkonia mesophila]|uniref:hypothetical protein n=1 Tax=Shumkonia mesophila TaxID=2838854 RepID=UPI002934CEF1|nr:hypothetical protein [Shumkonia mesophila]